MTKTAAHQAAERWRAPTLALDLVALGRTMLSDGMCHFDDLQIVGADGDSLDLSEGSAVDGLVLDSCVLRSLALPAVVGTRMVLRECSIDRVFGVADQSALPAWIEGCTVASFDPAGTSAAIVGQEHLGQGVRCLLVVLRKLFLQSGSGRQRAAFYRGLDGSWRPTVDAVLDIVRREGLAMPASLRGNEVWLPVREARERALSILTQLLQSQDAAVVAASALR